MTEGPSATASPATPAPVVATQPPSCALPNRPAQTLEPVAPDTPALAAQQGISGEVTVIVSLDAQSHVVAARILRSPSAILNAAALEAARSSRFQTETQDCRPIAADYGFVVEFSNQ